MNVHLKMHRKVFTKASRRGVVEFVKTTHVPAIMGNHVISFYHGYAYANTRAMLARPRVNADTRLDIPGPVRWNYTHHKTNGDK